MYGYSWLGAQEDQKFAEVDHGTQPPLILAIGPQKANTPARVPTLEEYLDYQACFSTGSKCLPTRSNSNL